MKQSSEHLWLVTNGGFDMNLGCLHGLYIC